MRSSATSRKTVEVAAVEAGDLADQGEAETGAWPIAAEAVEGREHLLPFGVGDAFAGVEDDDRGATGVLARRRRADRRTAVAFGVFEEVADQAAEEARVAGDERRCRRVNSQSSKRAHSSAQSA